MTTPTLIFPPRAIAHVLVCDLKPGDVIHAPAREMRLWMKRTAAQQGRGPEWLTLTVVSVAPSESRGAEWACIKATQPGNPIPWTLLAKASTKWPLVSRPSA